MHLQQQPGGQGLTLESRLQLHHRQLDDVGAGPLDRCVGRSPQLLGFHAAASGDLKIDRKGILAQQTPQSVAIEVEGAPAAQDRFHVTTAEGEAFLQLQEGEHPRVALLVARQKLLGLRLADAGFPGEALGSHPVDHTEVDRFAEAPFIGRHLRFVEQQAGSEGMHVVAVLVGLLKHLFAGQMGQDPQFDLGVIGAQQLPALLGQKGLADPT